MAEQMHEHNLTLKNREKLTMTGISEVISFDEHTVIVESALGTLIVQGEDLKLKTLSVDGGQIGIDGNVSSLSYEQPRSGGRLRRLFS